MISEQKCTVSAIERRLGRGMSDVLNITASVQRTAGLLNMLAYTFELMGLSISGRNSLLCFTRAGQCWKNLPPHIIEHYNESVIQFVNRYVTGVQIPKHLTTFSRKHAAAAGGGTGRL